MPRPRFSACVLVGSADGTEAEDPYLAAECGADDLTSESLRMLEMARALD